MLTKYQAEAAGAAAVAASGSSYSSQHARMYPYVSAMGQTGFPGVAGYSNALANAAESAAATAAAAADKQCRYTGSAAAAASMAEAMVNYSLGAHQNGVAGAAAASMAQAAAANFYQQAANAGGAAAAAAAAAAGVDPNNPLSACSHGGPPTGLGALAGVQTGGGPDIPRYPWMSITGES